MKGKIILSLDTKVELLFLSEEDLIEAGALNMEHCVEVIDEMFRILGEEDYLLGGPAENDHGVRIWFPKEKRSKDMPVAGPDRRFMALASYLGGSYNIAGEKWYGSNVENSKKGLPRSILTISLNDVETGQPISYMSGNLISAMRTGAVPGVATKYLASDQAKTVAIIGAGVISWSSIRAILLSRKELKKVNVFDIQKDRAEDFCDKLMKEFNVEAVAYDSMDNALNNADLINIATSGPVQPEVKEEQLKDGAVLMISGGAKISDDLLLNNRIVFDNWEMHRSTADDWVKWEYLQSNIEGIRKDLFYGIGGQTYRLIKENKLNESDLTNLGDIVTQKKSGRSNDKEKIIFFAGGMATEDIAWAYTLYKAACDKNIGQKLKLWDKPHWS